MTVEPSRTMRPALLLAIFALAFALRLAVALWLPQESVWPDGSRYERVALHLLNGEGFGPLSENAGSVPTQVLLIAGVYSLFGQSYLALRVFFALLGACVCVLGALLATRHFGAKAGVVAGLGLSVYPYLVYLSALFEYPQTFFMLCIAAALLLYQRFAGTGSLRTLFGVGLSLGLAVLSVPTVLAFVLLFATLLLTRELRASAIRLAVLGSALLLVIGPWTARNYVAYGTPILVNIAGGFAFWAGNNDAYWKYGKPGVVPPCRPGYEDTVYCERIRSLEATVNARADTDTARVLEQDRLSWQYGIEYVRESPGRYLLMCLQRFARFWSPIPDATHAGEAHGGRWRDLVALASYTPVLMLAIGGLVATRERWRELLPLYLYIAALTAPYVFIFTATRYRLPIDFVLILFASAALDRLWRPSRPQQVRRRQDA